MKGKILHFDIAANEGTILCNLDEYYTFTSSDWEGKKHPYVGQFVDFLPNEETATFIHPDMTLVHHTGPQKIAAVLLAFFLGGFGMHKFYMGYKKEGLIMLLCFLLGFLLLGIPSAIVGLIAFVEFIVYLIKSDEDFDKIYVQGNKGWF